jgi:hypothetical protein
VAAKSKLTEVVPKLVALLGRVEAAERGRAIQAALLTLGGESIALPPPGAGGGGGGGANNFGGGAGAGGQMTAKAYFDEKAPTNKIEELAVAARYREEHAKADTNTKNEIGTVIKDARRNFDASNFTRDLNNAKRAKLFNLGSGRDAHQLSYHGQKYVDALPNREAVKALAGNKKKGGKKKKAVKK